MASISTLVDRVKILASSSGTGSFALGSPVPSFRGSDALLDGATYSYAVGDGSNFEVGTGLFSASGNTLSRTPAFSSNGNGPVDFPVNVEISFTAMAADLVAVGGAFPIVDSLGNLTGSAISQKAATDGINAALASTAAFAASLLSSTALNGPNLVAWFHDATAVPGSLAAAWKLHANPMNSPWNAAGDGTTDDTAKLQACLNWLKATGNGGVMDLTHKHLIDSADLIVPRYVSIKMRVGSGSVGNPAFFGHTNAYADLAAVPKLIMNPAYSVRHGSTGGNGLLEGIIFGRKGLAYDGNDSAANYAGNAVILTNTSGVTLRDCTFLGFAQSVFSDGSSQIRLEFCQHDGLGFIRFKNGFDINTAIDCRAYNFLQSGVDGFDARTKRDAKAYLCDGTSNGGHQFINCFAYGYRYAFSMETAGSYLLSGCWADGGRVLATGRSYWADGGGFNLISGNTSNNAECRITDCKSSAQATGIYVGAGMYGATLISGCHMWECNDTISIAASNVQVSNCAIRGHFVSGITYLNDTVANASSLSDIIMYDRQGSPNTPVDISCSLGSPRMRNVRYVGGDIAIFNKGVYTVSVVSEFLTYDFDRPVMFTAYTGVTGDAGPKIPGAVITIIFTADNVTHFGGPDGPSSFYNDAAAGNFVTRGPFRATAGSSITFYRNAANTKWVEVSRTLLNQPADTGLSVRTAAGAIAMAAYDNIIVVNKATGAATAVTLPASPLAGKRVTIKDGKGDAATNNITIAAASGNIDGAANLVLNANYAAANLVYNGAQWNRI